MARGDKKDYKAATFRLPPDVLERLEQESRRTGVPKSVLVERALKFGLHQEPETAKRPQLD